MKLRKLLLTSVLSSLAVAFSIAERALPVPLPGVSLGISNVFVTAALVLLGAKAAFAVILARSLLSLLISGNVFAFFCSISGGLLSGAVMSPLFLKCGKKISLPWISVAGAWAFNAGQLAAAAYLIGCAAAAAYVIPLLIAGTVTGWAVGAAADVVCRRIKSGGPDMGQ